MEKDPQEAVWSETRLFEMPVEYERSNGHPGP